MRRSADVDVATIYRDFLPHVSRAWPELAGRPIPLEVSGCKLNMSKHFKGIYPRANHDLQGHARHAKDRHKLTIL